MPKPTKTREEFIKQVNEIFNSKYDCSKVVYVNNHTKVTLVCPVHGDFTKRPADLTVKKSGCAQCTGTQFCGAYHKKDSIWFAQEGARIHNSKYDYSQVQYVRYHQKVVIICPDHGEFQQTAGSHISNGSGCPKCSVKDYEGGYGVTRFTNHPEIKSNSAMLYVIKCTDGQETFLKIGITQYTLDHRFRKTNRLPYDYEPLYSVNGLLYDLFLLEQAIKKQFKSTKYRPIKKFNGHTECLNIASADGVITTLSNHSR